MILSLIIIIGVYSTFGTSTASVSTDVWKKLTEVETILVDMVAQIADVKERLDTEKAESTTACPDRWVAYKGSFYYFGSTTVTFSEAQDICTSLGAHLVHVDNYLENVFLKGFMNSHSKHCYWVGLTDAAKEGLWKLTRKNTIAPFLDWGSSEPRGGTSENCVIFETRHWYRWADVPCSVKNRYLCERI